MAKWHVSPALKKSVVEITYLTKGEDTISIQTVWRWGNFYVYTKDDNPPDIYPGIDIYNCEYETELIDTTDGCYEEVNYDTCSEETQEWLEKFFEDGNSYLDLEEKDWILFDSQLIIECESTVEKVEDEVV